MVAEESATAGVCVRRVALMPREKPIELFTPPNTLKAKMGGALPAIDQKAIARAEAALAGLQDQFGNWIQEELARLTEAWTDFDRKGDTAETRAELHRRSHDLKGLAPTYGYPLIGRICNSLSKLTGEEADHLKPPKSLLKAHVDAVKAIVQGKITNPTHPVGAALANELEAQMLKLIQAAG
jgi:HPt (histidine-containing phosphotransfer) domain-containing protein